MTIDTINYDRASNTLNYIDPNTKEVIPLGNFEKHSDEEFVTKEEFEKASLSVQGSLTLLKNRLALCEAELKILKITNPIEIDIASTDFTNSTKDAIVNDGVLTDVAVRNITANSIQMESTSLINSRLNLIAENDVNINNLMTSGDYPKSQSNVPLSINSNGVVSISNSTINQTSYNGIEIGLSNTTPRNILIDNINFEGKLSNNAILIFAHKNNANITISNATFNDVSNCVRISNRTNVPATINFINCTCNKWDSNDAWKGFLILEDYTSANLAEAEEAKRFSNLKINFINCYGPDGKIEGDVKTLIDNHIIYINIDKAGNKQYEYNDETKQYFPELTVQ